MEVKKIENAKADTEIRSIEDLKTEKTLRVAIPKGMEVASHEVKTENGKTYLICTFDKEHFTAKCGEIIRIKYPQDKRLNRDYALAVVPEGFDPDNENFILDVANIDRNGHVGYGVSLAGHKFCDHVSDDVVSRFANDLGDRKADIESELTRLNKAIGLMAGFYGMEIDASTEPAKADPAPDKSWRAEEGGRYYYITECGEVLWGIEKFDEDSEAMFEFGNYFDTEKAATEAVEKLRATLRTCPQR